MLPQPDLRSLVQQSRTIDPGTELGGISFPYSRRAPIAILLRRRNSPGYEYADTVYFNPYNGAYLSTWRYGVNQSLGDWIIWSQVPLHFGTYWGLGTKDPLGGSGTGHPVAGDHSSSCIGIEPAKRWKRLRRGSLTPVAA